MKITIEQIKEIAEEMSKDFRVIKSPTLFNPHDTRMKGTLRGDYIAMILGDYKKDGIDDDVEVAKKALAYTTAIKLGLKCSPTDF